MSGLGGRVGLSKHPTCTELLKGQQEEFARQTRWGKELSRWKSERLKCGDETEVR